MAVDQLGESARTAYTDMSGASLTERIQNTILDQFSGKKAAPSNEQSEEISIGNFVKWDGCGKLAITGKYDPNALGKILDIFRDEEGGRHATIDLGDNHSVTTVRLPADYEEPASHYEATTPFLSAENYRDLARPKEKIKLSSQLKDGEMVIKYQGQLITAYVTEMDISQSASDIARIRIDGIKPEFIDYV
jgi:hypothetical protein